MGILNKHGEPLDRELLAGLTQSLIFRGPDAQHIWTGGPAGLGHTLFHTGLGPPREKQPCTLDGSVWITADARIDARADLVAALSARGRHGAREATDAELILHAYHVWGVNCVEHLLGDFAFAIWDGPSQRLFCARDHLGVKPFFYADRPGCFVFSNTLDTVRLHGEVSRKLDDLAIADFLLFGGYQDPAGTAFADIRRLPAAHSLTAADGRLSVRRYWTMPVDEPCYYRRGQDYVDRFHELLREAVRDRSHTDRIAVLMSGGLDSPSLAATANDPSVSPARVSAFTMVFDRLFPDQERHFAGLVAKRLGIPIHFWVADEPERLRYSQMPVVHTPEPEAEPWFLEHWAAYWREMASLGRVAFHGEGPDNALHYEWRPHLAWLFRNRRWGRLLGDVGFDLLAHRRVPLLSRIPAMLRSRRVRREWDVPFPPWLSQELTASLDLRRRYAQVNEPEPSPHPVRPVGYRSFQTLLWPQMYEACDPAWTRVPLEIRHPFADLRVLRFLLSVPGLPWCRAKYLMRRVSRGVLPPEVLSRPKAPLSGDPGLEKARLFGLPSFFEPTSELVWYVNPERLSPSVAEGPAKFSFDLRPAALNWWLRALAGGRESLNREISHELAERTIGQAG
ncbi:MAG: asparagine synthase-related protein [Bryobacterales bacterium]|nr:asparagine synthase-related protein [Bryobacterales bacterium]